jgi:glyoxylase-like metal-dependent hydrolase (beta-lactamase superfamily II)
MGAPTMRIGNVEIMAVQDAGPKAPLKALFPHCSDADWEPHKHWNTPDGQFCDMSITQYVVRSGGKTILIDTGIGAKDRPFFPNGRLPEALPEAGVPLDSIDIVACSHMHIDHVGWHTTKQGDAYVPTFPKSTLVFVKDEWEYFTGPEGREQPHIVDCVLPIKDSADIELVGSEHQLTDEITLFPAPGHTPAHSTFLINSAGERGIIWGDLCHHPAQVTELWSPMFDLDPVQSRESRDRVLQRIEDEDLRVAAGHFPHPGFGRVERVDGKRYWRGL